MNKFEVAHGVTEQADTPDANLNPPHVDIQAHLGALPAEVRQQVANLPLALQAELFAALAPAAELSGRQSDGLDQLRYSEDERFQELVGSLDQGNREYFLERSLGFLLADYPFLKIDYDTNSEALRPEILRLLEVIWSNRGQSEPTLYSQLYIQELRDRQQITEYIEQQIADEKTVIAKTKKPDALARRGENLRQFEADLERQKLEIGRVQQLLGTGPSRFQQLDLQVRLRDEERWMKLVSETTEYLPAIEFVSAIEGALRNLHYRARSRKSEIKPISTAEEAALEAVDQAVNEWFLSHENDPAMKQPVDSDRKKKQQKLIGYFQSLYSSFVRYREAKGEDQLTVIRQMEVTLHLLKRFADRIEAPSEN